MDLKYLKCKVEATFFQKNLFFQASSSSDGTVKIWKIKLKKCIHTLNNVIPKCNSFGSAKVYGTPSFNDEYLAYPHGKKIVVLEKSSWKELFTLTLSEIKNVRQNIILLNKNMVYYTSTYFSQDLSICKFSDCGTLLVASSIYGEMIVWDIKKKTVVGYVEHQQNAKITSLAWKPDSTNEIAFCDALGQLSCIEVVSSF